MRRSCKLTGHLVGKRPSQGLLRDNLNLLQMQILANVATHLPKRRHTSANRAIQNTNAMVPEKRAVAKPQSKPEMADSRKRDDVKLVKSAPIVSSSEDSDNYAFAIRDINAQLPQQLEENRVPLSVGGIKLVMFIDSGASRSLLDSWTWTKL